MLHFSNQLTGATGVQSFTYSYDQAGNTLGNGTLTFGYNGAGRMVAATQGTSTTYFAVNALGQRVSKTSSAGTTLFAYDEQGHLIGEYTGTGALIEETAWMGDIPVATLRPDASGAVDIYYVHTDHLNAPRRVTRSSDNTIVWLWNSDPYGLGFVDNDPDGDGQGFVYNLRFPGQYYDAETGLSYNYYRDYDPGTGRYVESDPVGLAGGSFATYAYAGGNPIAYSDRTGQILPLLVIPGICGAGGCEAIAALFGLSVWMSTPSGQKAVENTASAISQTNNCCTHYTDVYEPNDWKHGGQPRQGPKGEISAEPTNPEATLATSVPAGEQRIGYDPAAKEIVLFNSTLLTRRSASATGMGMWSRSKA